jgi:hypothetical protein
MLNITDVRGNYIKQVYNKYLSNAYFVKKKYDEMCIIESALELELFKSVIDESIYSDSAKKLSVDDITNAGVINIYNTYNMVTGGASAYTHTQTSLSAVWQVTHSLGYKPSQPSIVDFTGQNLDGIINHIDDMHLTITFSSPKSGYAYFS